jgi:hypothetical protein
MMAGHRPFSALREWLDKRLAAQRKTREPLRDWWTDVRFRHVAGSRDEAGEQVERLIEAADELGFELEVGSTTPNPPDGPVGG